MHVEHKISTLSQQLSSNLTELNAIKCKNIDPNCTSANMAARGISEGYDTSKNGEAEASLEQDLDKQPSMDTSPQQASGKQNVENHLVEQEAGMQTVRDSSEGQAVNVLTFPNTSAYQINGVQAVGNKKYDVHVDPIAVVQAKLILTVPEPHYQSNWDLALESVKKNEKHLRGYLQDIYKNDDISMRDFESARKASAKRVDQKIDLEDFEEISLEVIFLSIKVTLNMPGYVVIFLLGCNISQTRK